MKAILVLDEMPDNCLKCKIFDHENASCPMSWEKFIWGIYDKEKPEWCSLKPLPKSKTVHDRSIPLPGFTDNFYTGYAAGWNKCLETITGGELNEHD